MRIVLILFSVATLLATSGCFFQGGDRNRGNRGDSEHGDHGGEDGGNRLGDDHR